MEPPKLEGVRTLSFFSGSQREGGAMGSALQTRIGEAVLEIPPMPGDELVAWVLMAEWREGDGQTKLTRLLAGESSARALVVDPLSTRLARWNGDVDV